MHENSYENVCEMVAILPRGDELITSSPATQFGREFVVAELGWHTNLLISNCFQTNLAH